MQLFCAMGLNPFMFEAGSSLRGSWLKLSRLRSQRTGVQRYYTMVWEIGVGEKVMDRMFVCPLISSDHS